MEKKSAVNYAIKGSNLRFITFTGIAILLLILLWAFTRYGEISHIFIVIAVPLLIYSLVTIIGRVSNPSKHPIARDLSRYGDWQQMAQEIDEELSKPHERGDNYRLTPHWLIFQTGTRFEAVPYRDLIWQYLFQINHRSYGISTYKTYFVKLHDRHGKTKTLPYGNKSDIALDLLKKLQARAPWAYLGFSADIKNAWEHKREKMISSVDARRQAIEQALVENQEVTGESEL